VLDASFSFDGVIGAFAITSDPIIIALGLGLIGAMFVRSLTVYLVRQGTLSEYVYLEHGAHWGVNCRIVWHLLTTLFGTVSWCRRLTGLRPSPTSLEFSRGVVGAPVGQDDP
jgi:hypothetical protein